MSDKKGHWDKNIRTHKNVIYACFGGFSNTGLTAALASLEAVKELGLEEACIGCLAGISTGVTHVLGKTEVADRVITVDDCPMECARKVVEGAGFKASRSIVLARDIGMKKKPLHEDIGGDLKGVNDYVSKDEIEKANNLIIQAIKED